MYNSWYHIIMRTWNKLRCEDGLSLKIKHFHIHRYFISTKYLWNNTCVEYKDSSTRAYYL